MSDQDLVSKRSVEDSIRECLRLRRGWIAGPREKFIRDVLADVHPVLPAGRSESLVPRDEEEIRAALDWLTKNAQKEEERSHEGPFGPGRIEVDICEHRSRVFKNCVSFYNWTQGEENEWSKTFTPPKNRKEETGDKTT